MDGTQGRLDKEFPWMLLMRSKNMRPLQVALGTIVLHPRPPQMACKIQEERWAAWPVILKVVLVTVFSIVDIFNMNRFSPYRSFSVFNHSGNPPNSREHNALMCLLFWTGI